MTYYDNARYRDGSLRPAEPKEFPWLDPRSADPVFYDGRWYPSAENAFQAARFGDRRMKSKIARMEPASAAYTGAVSRHSMPDDGPEAIRAMYRVMLSKFSDPAMRDRLLSTGMRPLTIRNARHDNLWGTCTCRKCRHGGEDRLGIILEKLRSDLRENDRAARTA